MALQLATPIEKEFPLKKSDKAYNDGKDATKIVIRQATQAQHERRSQLWAELTQEVVRDMQNPDAAPEAIRYIQKLSLPETQRVEAYLTLVSCSILDIDGAELFKFKKTDGGTQVLNMTEGEFKVAWGKLPPLIAGEISECVRNVNVTWGPEGEAS
jgi:hypothetical protein